MSILNTNIVVSLRAFLLVFVAPTGLVIGYLTGGYLTKEAEAAEKNAQLCEQADHIEELQKVIDLLDQKVELLESTSEETEAAATALIQETMAEREAAYARLYK